MELLNVLKWDTFKKKIANSSIDYQRKVESRDRFIVGVNEFVKENEEIDIPILKIRKEVEDEQIQKIENIKESRDNDTVEEKLKAITLACTSKDNLIPLIIEASQAYATLGEIVSAMKEVFGEWNENTTI